MELTKQRAKDVIADYDFIAVRDGIKGKREETKWKLIKYFLEQYQT